MALQLEAVSLLLVAAVVVFAISPLAIAKWVGNKLPRASEKTLLLLFLLTFIGTVEATPV